MIHYAKLDALILERIARPNGATLTELQASETICTEAERIADATGRPDWRIIDGRLQDMRKQGLIRFWRPVWKLTERVRAA